MSSTVLGFTISPEQQELRESSADLSLLSMDMVHEHAHPLCHDYINTDTADFRFKPFSKVSNKAVCSYCFGRIDPIEGEILVRAPSYQSKLHLPQSYRGIPGLDRPAGQLDVGRALK